MPSESLREALNDWLVGKTPPPTRKEAFASGWHLALRHVQTEAERRHLVDLVAWIDRLLMER